MRSLHYPTASLESRFGQLVVGLFTSLLDVWLIVPLNDCIRCRRALVARIGAEIVLPRLARHLHYKLVQRGLKQFYVMCLRRWRRSRAGRQSRRPTGFVCARFFPRSVGLGPTHSVASGALCIAPSILCQFHAMASISSYSASPACHRRRKKSPCCHFRKCKFTALALPNSRGRAFHWQPVRNT